MITYHICLLAEAGSYAATWLRVCGSSRTCLPTEIGSHAAMWHCAMLRAHYNGCSTGATHSLCMCAHMQSWWDILTLVLDSCDPSTPLYRVLIIVVPRDANQVPRSSSVSVATLLPLATRCIEQVGMLVVGQQDGWSVTWPETVLVASSKPIRGHEDSIDVV
jgi:hypothetical protein